MTRTTHHGAVVLLVIGMFAAAVDAADHPVSGAQLTLRERNGKGNLSLALQDASIPVPAPGASDDPSTTGMTLTLFSRGSGERATLLAAPGVGADGWRVKSTATAVTFRYRDRDAGTAGGDIQTASLRTRAALRIRARSAGLDLSQPHGPIAVRIEFGATRVCAVFGDGAIKKTTTGLFVAGRSATGSLADCDDDTLAQVPCGGSASCGGDCPGDAQCGSHPWTPGDCVCVSPHQPCGDSAPVCNGECADGSTCGSVTGGPETACACLPTQSTPCGELDVPACDGGGCPEGRSCMVETFTVAHQTFDYCACRTEPQPLPCGGCPTGWVCVGFPGQDPFCAPPP